MSRQISDSIVGKLDVFKLKRKKPLSFSTIFLHFPSKSLIQQIGEHPISFAISFLRSTGNYDWSTVYYVLSPPSHRSDFLLYSMLLCRGDLHDTEVIGSLKRNMLELVKDSTIERASTISESVEAGLRFIGMWPRCVYANINWWTYIVSVAIVQYFQYSYILVHFDISDLSATVDGLSITLGYSLSFLKLINLWFNRR